MSEDKPETPGKSGPISEDELIRSQLQGKSKALERYDAILWKIRSGYIVVLYGALTVIAGKESKLPEIIATATTLNALFLVAAGISVSALLVDLGFLLSKLRVVAARDRLSDIALKLAQDESFTEDALTEDEKDELVKLLHLSGEAATWPPWRLVANGTWSLPFLYLSTPTVLFILSR